MKGPDRAHDEILETIIDMEMQGVTVVFRVRFEDEEGHYYLIRERFVPFSRATAPILRRAFPH